jgi:hypothetical protein
MNTPEGYMADHKGNLVALANVKAQHKLEDELVNRLYKEAKHLNEELSEFKALAFDEVEDFLALLSQQYETKRGGKKGNVTLTSFDGTKSVELSVNEYLQFGPELEAAKDLIDECLREWSTDANPHLRTIVEAAFKVDKKGEISTTAVLGLRRHDIDDPKWQRAMQAISDAVRPNGSKRYIRIYERDGQDNGPSMVSLNIATV